MKKFLLKFITIILSVALTFSLVACDTTEDDDVVTGTFEYQYVEDEDDEDGGYYKITGYNVNSEDIENDFKEVDAKYRNLVIPETAKDLGVTAENRKDLKVKEIGASAFAGKTILKKVTIGKNIETIGLGAFAGCFNLEEMTIPFVGKSADAVNKERIFAHLFTTTDDVSGLNTEITVKLYSQKDGNGNDLNSDEALTYYVPTSLKKVTVTGGEIKTSAFYGFTTLQEVVLDGEFEYIGGHAFFDCTSLKKVTMPNTVKEIYQNAFANCMALRTLPFDENSQIELIGREAFSQCTSIGANSVSALVKTEIFPQTLKNIGERAFYSCSGIRGIDLTNTQVTVIETSVFENCTSLEKLVLKDGMTILSGAFIGCEKLEKDDILNYNTLNVHIDAFDFEQ